MNEKLESLLKSIPGEKNRDEDFDPGDACGANFSDTYEMGFEDGYRHLANQVRRAIGIPKVMEKTEEDED